MTGGQLALPHPALHRLRQLQEPDGVGDMAATLAHFLGHILLGAVEAVDQLLIGHAFLDGVEVGALHILDDGDFQRLAIRQLAHHHRHVMQLGHLGSAPATLARHDLIAVGADGPHQDGRQHAFLADGIRQVGQRLLGKRLARLEAARLQERHGQGARVLFRYRLAANGGGFIADQRRQPASQSARTIILGHHATGRSLSRWITSPASLI